MFIEQPVKQLMSRAESDFCLLRSMASLCVVFVAVLNFFIAQSLFCHRHRYMNGWYDKGYDKAPTLSTSIQIARTKNMRLYCGQQRGTSNPVSCDIAPLKDIVSGFFRP